ncbi:MAG: YicC/YloC family endoribonuclease [Pseudomonadota bacterium]
MTYSMTAFSREEMNNVNGQLTIEIRSLNHRFLEINCRLPEELRSIESSIREITNAHLSRGRIDISIRWQEDMGKNTKLELNKSLANELARVASQLKTKDSLNLIDIMRWPGVVKTKDPNKQKMQKLVTTTYLKTLKKLIQSRKNEGNKTKKFVLERCLLAEKTLAKIKKQHPVSIKSIRKKLKDRFADIKKDLDPHRFEQEILFFLNKIDIDEEIDRLGSHLQDIKKTLKLDQPVGRKLDFIVQECNREINTISSKSSDIKITKESVELKVLAEQMREQIQNIE